MRRASSACVRIKHDFQVPPKISPLTSDRDWDSYGLSAYGLMIVLWKSMWYLEATNVSFCNELIDFYWFYFRVLVSGKGELDHDLSLIPRDCSPYGLKCENVLHWINPLPPFGARDTPPVNHGNRYARWARLSTNQRTTADRWRPPWDRDKTIGDSQIQIMWWT